MLWPSSKNAQVTHALLRLGWQYLFMSIVCMVIGSVLFWPSVVTSRGRWQATWLSINIQNTIYRKRDRYCILEGSKKKPRGWHRRELRGTIVGKKNSHPITSFPVQQPAFGKFERQAILQVVKKLVYWNYVDLICISWSHELRCTGQDIKIEYGNGQDPISDHGLLSPPSKSLSSIYHFLRFPISLSFPPPIFFPPGRSSKCPTLCARFFSVLAVRPAECFFRMSAYKVLEFKLMTRLCL